MDLLWCAVDAKLPISAEAKGEPFNPDVCPVTSESHWIHPANDWRGELRTSWYQGGVFPTNPRGWVDIPKVGHGAMFKGTKGHIVADFNSRCLLPIGGDADLTYYKPRTKENQLPPVNGFQEQWLRACRNPTIKTACDFEYSADMIEQLLLGLVAFRVGKKLDYDPVAGKVTNAPEANEFLTKKYRDGWTLNG